MSKYDVHTKGFYRLMMFLLAAVPLLGSCSSLAYAVEWSWESTVAPLDVSRFAAGLSYKEWRQVDEITTRRLFEDIIRRALRFMDLSGRGGEFEKLLRQDLLSFVPEWDYYWPSCEGDPAKRTLKFPVTVLREESQAGEALIFRLGRYGDKREIRVEITPQSSPVMVITRVQNKFLPGIRSLPKREYMKLEIYTSEARLSRIYKETHYDPRAREYEETEEVFRDDGVIEVYRKGLSKPVVDRTSGGPRLDLSGVEVLFDLAPEYWTVWDHHFYQTARGLVNLCMLELGLEGTGYELEKLLWRDFFPFAYDSRYFGMASESVDVRRQTIGEEERAVFLFDIGNVHTARHLYVTLSKEFAPPGYEWGVEQISLSRPIIVNGAIGEEERVMEFLYGMGDVLCLDYTLTQSDNEGHTTVYKTLAYFRHNNPYNILYNDRYDVTTQFVPVFIASGEKPEQEEGLPVRAALETLRTTIIERLPHDEKRYRGERELLTFILSVIDPLLESKSLNDNYYLALKTARTAVKGLGSSKTFVAWLERCRRIIESAKKIDRPSIEQSNFVELGASLAAALISVSRGG